MARFRVMFENATVLEPEGMIITDLQKLIDKNKPSEQCKKGDQVMTLGRWGMKDGKLTVVFGTLTYEEDYPGI